MASTSLNDFGDAIRSYANTGDEDDRDLSRVGLSLEMFRAYTEGYLSQRAKQLTDSEIDHLAFSARYITFEQVLRFLMDYIDGDTYYKVKYPGHNLVRTRPVPPAAKHGGTLRRNVPHRTGNRGQIPQGMTEIRKITGIVPTNKAAVEAAFAGIEPQAVACCNWPEQFRLTTGGFVPHVPHGRLPDAALRRRGTLHDGPRHGGQRRSLDRFVRGVLHRPPTTAATTTTSSAVASDACCWASARSANTRRTPRPR